MRAASRRCARGRLVGYLLGAPASQRQPRRPPDLQRPRRPRDGRAGARARPVRGGGRALARRGAHPLRRGRPRVDTALVDAWFAGRLRPPVRHAVRESEAVRPAVAGVTIRPGTKADLLHVARLDRELWVHQAGSPSFSGQDVEALEAFEADWAEDTFDASDTLWPFVAERDGEVVGEVLLYRRPTGDLRVPEGNVDLSRAATDPAVPRLRRRPGDRRPRPRVGTRAGAPLRHGRLARREPPRLALLAAARLARHAPAPLPRDPVTRVPLLAGTRVVVADAPDDAVVLRPPAPGDGTRRRRRGRPRRAALPARRASRSRTLATRGGHATIVVEPPALPDPGRRARPARGGDRRDVATSSRRSASLRATRRCSSRRAGATAARPGARGARLARVRAPLPRPRRGPRRRGRRPRRARDGRERAAARPPRARRDRPRRHRQRRGDRSPRRAGGARSRRRARRRCGLRARTRCSRRTRRRAGALAVALERALADACAGARRLARAQPPAARRFAAGLPVRARRARAARPLTAARALRRAAARAARARPALAPRRADGDRGVRGPAVGRARGGAAARDRARARPSSTAPLDTLVVRDPATTPTCRARRRTRSWPRTSRSGSRCGSGATRSRSPTAGRRSSCNRFKRHFAHPTQPPYRGVLRRDAHRAASRTSWRGRRARGRPTRARSRPTAPAAPATRCSRSPTGPRARRRSGASARCSSPGAATPSAARQLGFVPAHSLGAALEMAHARAGDEPSIGFLLSPPYFPLVVGRGSV